MPYRAFRPLKVKMRRGSSTNGGPLGTGQAGGIDETPAVGDNPNPSLLVILPPLQFLTWCSFY